jgi:hypothetical protein
MLEDTTWNPWKMTAIGMMLVVVAAVIMGLLMADWGPRPELEALLSPAVSSAPPTVAPTEVVAQSPSPADVEACNQYAKAQAGDKAIEVVKEGAAAEVGRGSGKGAALGGMVTATAGTLHGINEGKKNDARYVEAYRACMKGRGFSS